MRKTILLFTCFFSANSVAESNIKITFAYIQPVIISVVKAKHGNAYCDGKKNPTNLHRDGAKVGRVNGLDCDLTHTNGKTDISFTVKSTPNYPYINCRVHFLRHFYDDDDQVDVSFHGGDGCTSVYRKRGHNGSIEISLNL